MILVLREFRRMATPDGRIEPEGVERYLRERRDGLTKGGVRYWLVARYQLGGVPFVGGPKLPDVDADFPASRGET